MIFNFRASVASNVLFFATTMNLSAHEGGHHDNSIVSQSSRTWSIAAEGAHLHAPFVSAKGKQVQIRKDDGTLINLAINRLIAADQAWIRNRLEEVKLLNRQQAIHLAMFTQPAQQNSKTTTGEKRLPEIGEHFKPFAKLLQLRWDDDYLYVGSNGLPEHPMSTKNDFLRGAIALAVNGVPIFNPLNNHGDDAYLSERAHSITFS